MSPEDDDQEIVPHKFQNIYVQERLRAERLSPCCILWNLFLYGLSTLHHLKANVQRIVSLQTVHAYYIGVTGSPQWRWVGCDAHNGMLCHSRKWRKMLVLALGDSHEIANWEASLATKAIFTEEHSTWCISHLGYSMVLNS